MISWSDTQVLNTYKGLSVDKSFNISDDTSLLLSSFLGVYSDSVADNIYLTCKRDLNVNIKGAI